MENYYKIVNLIDEIAKEGRPATEQEISFITDLADDSDINVGDLADANDCGDCETWVEVIDAFTKLWEQGERVEI